MRFEPLRFIHAANLFLDAPLRETGPLPDEVRKTVEDATLIALERIVAACIAEQVDFLLLAGNSFVERDRSLRARAALLDGFQRLAEHAIRVFILPGPADPPEAWRALAHLPGNVTPFFNSPGEPVAVIRDGTVIAAVSGAVGQAAGLPAEPGSFGHDLRSRSGDPSRFTESRRVPFMVGLMTTSAAAHLLKAAEPSGDDSTHPDGNRSEPVHAGTMPSVLLSDCLVDYLAVGGGIARRTIALHAGVAHDPGSPQGLSPREIGPHGCTLVEVDAHGTLQSRFLPTAPVRWESFTATVDPHTTRDELAARLRSALTQCRPESVEEVVLIRWTIRGSGPLFDSLRDEAVQRKLAELCRPGATLGNATWSKLPASAGKLAACPTTDLSAGDVAVHSTSGEVRLFVSHMFRLLPAVEGLSHENSLAAEYLTLLAGEQPLSESIFEKDLQHSVLPEEASNRLQLLLAGLDHERIAGHACRYGMSWFASTPDGDERSEEGLAA